MQRSGREEGHGQRVRAVDQSFAIFLEQFAQELQVQLQQAVNLRRGADVGNSAVEDARLCPASVL